MNLTMEDMKKKIIVCKDALETGKLYRENKLDLMVNVEELFNTKIDTCGV